MLVLTHSQTKSSAAAAQSVNCVNLSTQRTALKYPTTRCHWEVDVPGAGASAGGGGDEAAWEAACCCCSRSRAWRALNSATAARWAAFFTSCAPHAQPNASHRERETNVYAMGTDRNDE